MNQQNNQNPSQQIPYHQSMHRQAPLILQNNIIDPQNPSQIHQIQQPQHNHSQQIFTQPVIMQSISQPSMQPNLQSNTNNQFAIHQPQPVQVQYQPAERNQMVSETQYIPVQYISTPENQTFARISHQQVQAVQPYLVQAPTTSQVHLLPIHQIVFQQPQPQQIEQQQLYQQPQQIQRSQTLQNQPFPQNYQTSNFNQLPQQQMAGFQQQQITELAFQRPLVQEVALPQMNPTQVGDKMSKKVQFSTLKGNDSLQQIKQSQFEQAMTGNQSQININQNSLDAQNVQENIKNKSAFFNDRGESNEASKINSSLSSSEYISIPRQQRIISGDFMNQIHQSYEGQVPQYISQNFAEAKIPRNPESVPQNLWTQIQEKQSLNPQVHQTQFQFQGTLGDQSFNAQNQKNAHTHQVEPNQYQLPRIDKNTPNLWNKEQNWEYQPQNQHSFNDRFKNQRQSEGHQQLQGYQQKDIMVFQEQKQMSHQPKFQYERTQQIQSPQSKAPYNYYTSKYYSELIENLYFEDGDGEISIYKNTYQMEAQTNQLRQERMMIICIDISTLYKEKRGKAINLVATLSSIRHENLMMIFNWWYIPDQIIFIECEAPIYESYLTENSVASSQKTQVCMNKNKKDDQKLESQITWKNYCKQKFTEDEIFDIVKRISGALQALHERNIIHRDVHPSKIQYFSNQGLNGVYYPTEHVKFNPIGMPFNFKKLLKRDNFSGHVNYSCPELILEKDIFSNKVDVWSLGCCIFYMYHKKDPFEGKNTNETKKNILNLCFDKHTPVKKFCDLKIKCVFMKSILFNCLQYSEYQRLAMSDIQNLISQQEQKKDMLLLKQIITEQKEKDDQECKLDDLPPKTNSENRSLEQPVQSDEINHLPKDDCNQSFIIEQISSQESKEDDNKNDAEQVQNQSSIKGMMKEQYQKIIPNNMLSEIKSTTQTFDIQTEEQLKIDVVQSNVTEGIAKPVTQQLQQNIILPDNTTQTIVGNEVIDNEGRNIFNECSISNTQEKNSLPIGIKKADIVTQEKIQKELLNQPQKIDEPQEQLDTKILINEQAELMFQIKQEEWFTHDEIEQIKKNIIAPELCPAIKNPTEIQDLRKIQEAEKVDIQEWIETAKEMLPEISTEIQQIKEEMAPLETNIILNHSKTQFNTKSLLFKSQDAEIINSMNNNMSSGNQHSSEHQIDEQPNQKNMSLQTISEGQSCQSDDNIFENKRDEVQQNAIQKNTSVFSNEFILFDKSSNKDVSKDSLDQESGFVRQCPKYHSMMILNKNMSTMAINVEAGNQLQFHSEKSCLNTKEQSNTEGKEQLSTNALNDEDSALRNESQPCNGINFRNAVMLNKSMEKASNLDISKMQNVKIIYDGNGDIYEGEYKMYFNVLIKHGVGRLINQSGTIFEGVWNNNQIEGICKIKYNNGDIYEGQIKENKQNGIGMKLMFATGERYQGEWLNGQMTGYGKYIFNTSDNKMYTGQFYCGEKYGKGVEKTDKYIYHGMFKYGQYDGFGRYEDFQTQVIYEGNFYEGQKHGFGQEYGPTEDFEMQEYEGYWMKGVKHGHGKLKTQVQQNSEIHFKECNWELGVISEVVKEAIGSKLQIEQLNNNSFSQMVQQIKREQETIQENIDVQYIQQDEIESQIQDIKDKTQEFFVQTKNKKENTIQTHISNREKNEVCFRSTKRESE